MADLGRLVVDLAANISQFTRDMNRASEVTESAVGKMKSGADMVKNALGAIGVALTVDAMLSEVNRAIDGLARLDDMAQKAGAGAETISKLGKVAAFTGTDIGAVDGAIIKLAKNMTTADDKGSKFAKAMTAIGISTDGIAQRDPAELFVEIANRLQDYEDGAGKAALMTDAISKSAAELLPYMNDVADSIDDFTGDTAEAAAAAAAYQDELGRVKLQYDEIVTSIVSAALPATNDFVGALKDVTREADGLISVGVDSWADDIAVGLARVVDVGVLIPKMFGAVHGSFKAVAADIEFLNTVAENTNPIKAAIKVAKGGNPLKEIEDAAAKREAAVMEANERYDKLWNEPANRMEQAVLARIAGRSDAAYMAGADALAGMVQSPTKPEEGKPKLSYGGDGGDGGGASSALQARLRAIESAYKQEQETGAYHENFMRELRAQGVVDLETYNRFRTASMEQTSDAAVRAYNAEIAVLQASRAAAKDVAERDAIDVQIKEKVAAKEKAIRDAQQARALQTLELSAAQADLGREMAAWSAQQDQAIEQLRLNNDLYGQSALEIAKVTNARRIQLEVEEKIRRAQGQGPVSQDAIDQFRMEGDAKAEAANREVTRGAALGVVDSQKMPGQIEAEQHADRIAALQSALEQELMTTEAGNRAIEEENRRHNETMESMRLSSMQNILSIAQSSADQLYNALKDAGMEQTALGKAMFIAQKAIQVASIIVNTEVAAAAAQAGMIAAAGATAAVSGPAGPAILAAGIAAGAAYATATRVMGYATAGIVAGTAIASAEGGYDIPAGVNPVTQLHEKEMVLPKAQAEVIRGLAANGGAAGGGNMKLTIVNQTTGRIDNVVEQRISATERALIIQESVAATAAQFGDPNSKVSRGLARNFNVPRTR